MSKVTIVQVAEHAGVSISTVSRVLNGSAKVNPEVAARVEEAIRTLNFVPNISARNIKGTKGLHIGLVLPIVDDDFFCSMLSAAVIAAASHGAIVSVYISKGESEYEKKCLQTAISAGVSALLFSPAGYISPEDFYQIVPRNFPVVILNRRGVIPDVPHIYHDYAQGAADAMKYLLRLDRRKIAFFAGFWTGSVTVDEALEIYHDETRRGAYPALDRLDGYIRALEENGIALDKELIVSCGRNYVAGYEKAKEFLASLKEFDAIFCGKDEVAAGILLALNEQKISVPEKVSMVSFDDSDFAIIPRPMLTTVKQYPKKLGAKAVEMCIDLINGKPVDNMVLGMELVIRNSTSGKD